VSPSLLGKEKPQSKKNLGNVAMNSSRVFLRPYSTVGSFSWGKGPSFFVTLAPQISQFFHSPLLSIEIATFVWRVVDPILPSVAPKTAPYESQVPIWNIYAP